MQRGLQVTTPDLEICDSRNGDPFTSPRSSGDFSRRISAVMAPTRSGLEPSSRPLPSRLSTDISSPPSTALGKESRNIYQRRVSLPCIIESPSSPVASNFPRQSCDFGRPPLSTEPLHLRNKSTDSHPSGAPSRLSKILSLTKTQQPVTVQAALPSSTDNTPVAPKPAESAPVAPGGRRRSVDLLGTGFLSPRTALALNRRKSLDQLRAAPPVPDVIHPGEWTADSKTRRDSDASTSETIVSSGQSSCATLVHPMMAMAGNDSRTLLDKIQSPSSSPASNDTLVEASETSETKGPTANIVSASSLAALRRASSASEPGVRSSLDLRSMTSPRHHDVEMKARHRRSMQEPLDASFFSPSLTSASSFQNKIDNSSNNASYTKQRASFSGSATVSGRFSRFWSYASGRESPEPSAIHSKDNSGGTLESVASNNNNEVAPWTMSDMGDGHYFTEKDFPASGRRSRNGVMNRLSGLWSRR